MQKADVLGYRPNVIARSLTTRRTNIIAVVVANLIDPFYAMMLDALTARINNSGRQTLLFTSPDETRLDETLSAVLQYQVDGIIVASAVFSSEILRNHASGPTPIVLFNRYMPDLQAHAVSCDNRRSGADVADYLASTNHRRPAFVSGIAEATTNQDRHVGFRDKWATFGRHPVEHVIGGAYTYAAGYSAARQLAGARQRPDAVFFASDIVALGGLQAFREVGLRVPDDISVVGFDDVPAASWPSFALTTVRQPMADMVARAIETIDYVNAGRRPRSGTRFLPGTLMIRGSSAARRYT